MEAAVFSIAAMGIGSVFVVIIGYFLPWIIALLRGTNSNGSIFLVNLLLGWTMIGWVIVLIWAFVAQRKNNAQQVIIVERK